MPQMMKSLVFPFLMVALLPGAAFALGPGTSKEDLYWFVTTQFLPATIVAVGLVDFLILRWAEKRSESSAVRAARIGVVGFSLLSLLAAVLGILAAGFSLLTPGVTPMEYSVPAALECILWIGVSVWGMKVGLRQLTPGG